uniref:Protein MMS22-like n=1 Tax=Cacopsylla melanoneura TaxID=428564 RepID=A0A8D9AVP1_9HEMI
MDFEDEDIFMDIDPKILSEKDRWNKHDHDDLHLENVGMTVKGFECPSKHISKDLQVCANSLIGFVNNVLSPASCAVLNDDSNDYVLLFDFLFEKSTALSNNIYELFNFTFTNIYQLESSLNSQDKCGNSKKINQSILGFFKYMLSYVDNYLKCDPNPQESIVIIWNNFNQLKSSLKPLSLIGSTTLSKQSLCHQQFHVYFNVHLYYLLTCYKLLYVQNEKMNSTQFTQYVSEIHSDRETINVDANSLRNDILLVMIQLTELSLKCFNKISQPEDVYHLSPFKCDCVTQFWFILKLICQKMDPHKSNELFWKNLDIVFGLLENEHQEDIGEDSKTDVPMYITCSKPYLYSIWFLKHLLSLNINSNDELIQSPENLEKFIDNFDCTEKITKKLTNVDNISENELRTILTLLDGIISLKETCKPDIITTLWEYFQKRLNSNFVLKSTPFAYTLSCLNNNRSALEVLTHVEQLISFVRKPKSEENSYTLFLRILGMYLMKYNHEQRLWNQIKGRMYSKFSQSKLSTLTEQGIQHVSNLFILLFYIKGNQELVKIQTFLNIILTMKDISPTTREIVLRTNLTFILINIRNNVSLDARLLSPIMNILNENCDHPNKSNYEQVIKLYLLTVNDVFKESEDLTLGQNLLLGHWMSKILSNTKVSSNVMNIFYNLLSLVLSKLRQYQPIERDSQMGMYFSCILEHVLPHLRTDFNFNIDTMETMTEFLSELTLFTLSGGVNYKSETFQILNMLIVNTNVNFELKMNYVKCLISNEDMHSFSLTTFIPNIEIIITQCYLLSLIVSEHTINDSMGKYVEAHCLQRFRQNYAASLSSQYVQEQVLNSSNEETLKQFLRDINLINASITGTEARTQFHNEVNSLFSIEDTLKHVVVTYDKNNSATGKTIITNVFTCVAIIVDYIGGILYKKSKPNTQLQCYIDTLLLQFQVRNIDFKLSGNTTHALRVSFHIYVNALIKLEPVHDNYIARVIKELIQIYLPRLINKIQYETPFSFNRSFNEVESKDMFLLDMIINLFLRKKCKVSDKNSQECLVFLHELLNEYNNVDFVSRFIKTSLDMLLNNLISLNEVDVCRNKIKTILTKCFTNPTVQTIPAVKNHVLIVLTKLSNENLAFSFGQYFQVLNFLLHSCCPGIVTEFRKNILIQKIKTVEMKRGVGEDKVLRNLMEQLDRNIKKVLLVRS